MPRANGVMTVARSLKITERLTETPKLQDWEHFARTYQYIQHRPEARAEGAAEARLGEYVLFQPNEVQLDLARRIEKARAEGRPGRFIILKARREGISTLVESIISHRCTTQKDRKAGIVAQDEDATDVIFQMMKTMWERLPHHGDDPGWSEEDLRPCHRRNNDGRLWLTHPRDESAGLNSDIRVSVSSSPDAARSKELHYFHGSEVAFWSNAKTLMGGLMPVFSKDPETLVVLESTANGVGGYFYEKFWAAYTGRDRQGRKVDTQWEAVFYPWHFLSNYALPLPEGVSWDDALGMFDDTLLGMIQEYDLTPEQAWWAYRTWNDDLDRDWNFFKQEFPGKPEEAFAFSGKRVFRKEALDVVKSRSVRKPAFVGDIVDAADMPEHARINYAVDMLPKLARAVPDRMTGRSVGPLWVWHDPVPGRRYVITVDPSSGSTAGDYAAINVLDVDDRRRQPAEWHGKVRPWQLAEIAVLLALHYNEGLLSWETTGQGHTLSAAIEQTGYWNIYDRSEAGATGSDRKFGWDTNRGSKAMMVEAGVSVVEAGLPCISSIRLFGELESLKEHTSDKAQVVAPGDEIHRRVRVGAPPGEHDDLAMAWFQGQAVADIQYGAASWALLPETELLLQPETERLRWTEDDDKTSEQIEAEAAFGWGAD